MQRGRKSADSLTIVPIGGPHTPEPPEEFSEAEAAVWRLTVGGMREGWFEGVTLPMLESYCSEVVIAQTLANQLRTLDVTDKRYGRFSAMLAQTTKSMMMIATKLRLTPRSNQQSIRDGRSHTLPGPKPWET